MILMGKPSIGHNSRSGWDSGPNSAGAVSVKLSFNNNSDKTLQSACFRAVPYDAGHRVQSCTRTRRSAVPLCFTGPVEPGAFRVNFLWEDVWYNPDIRGADVRLVKLIYTDGSELLP